MNDHLHSLRFGVMIARVKGAGGARRIRVGFWVLLIHKYLQEPHGRPNVGKYPASVLTVRVRFRVWDCMSGV